MSREKHIHFLKTTFIGGLVFLVPLVVLVLVINEAIDIMIIIAEPMAELLPVDTVSDVVLANLLAVTALVIICFLAGLLARQAVTGKFVTSLENKVLVKIPGYTMIKGITGGLNPEETEGLRPVLWTLGSTQRFGIEIEQLKDGRCVTYTPSPPSFSTGITQIVPANQIQYVDVPVLAIMEYTEQFNRGTEKLLSMVIQPKQG